MHLYWPTFEHQLLQSNLTKCSFRKDLWKRVVTLLAWCLVLKRCLIYSTAAAQNTFNHAPGLSQRVFDSLHSRAGKYVSTTQQVEGEASTCNDSAARDGKISAFATQQLWTRALLKSWKVKGLAVHWRANLYHHILPTFSHPSSNAPPGAQHASLLPQTPKPVHARILRAMCSSKQGALLDMFAGPNLTIGIKFL
jgi:hypothetical protein